VLIFVLIAAGLWYRDALRATLERWSVRNGPEEPGAVKRRFELWNLWRYSLILALLVIVLLQAPGELVLRLAAIGFIAALFGLLIRDSYQEIKSTSMVPDDSSLMETHGEA